MHAVIPAHARRGRRSARDPRAAEDGRSALLSRSCRNGDEHARATLVELHLPLVRALARQYAHGDDALDDLVQVGSIGLIEAVDRFDPDRCTTFEGFAVPTISGAMKRYLRDRGSLVRIPRRAAELSRALRPTHDALAARLRRQPSVAELAEEAGVREAEVREAIETERARRPVELTSGGGTLVEIPAEDAFETSEIRLLLAAGFRTLAARERRILHLRYFGGLSQSEIAREVGLSQNQVSRLIQASLERLRGALDDRRGQAESVAVERPAGAVPCARDPWRRG